MGHIVISIWGGSLICIVQGGGDRVKETCLRSISLVYEFHSGSVIVKDCAFDFSIPLFVYAINGWCVENKVKTGQMRKTGIKEEFNDADDHIQPRRDTLHS